MAPPALPCFSSLLPCSRTGILACRSLLSPLDSLPVRPLSLPHLSSSSPLPALPRNQHYQALTTLLKSRRVYEGRSLRYVYTMLLRSFTCALRPYLLPSRMSRSRGPHAQPSLLAMHRRPHHLQPQVRAVAAVPQSRTYAPAYIVLLPLPQHPRSQDMRERALRQVLERCER